MFGSDEEMEIEQDGDAIEDESQDDSAVLMLPVTPAPIITPDQLGERSIFHTFRPEGGLRDVLTVECLKINLYRGDCENLSTSTWSVNRHPTFSQNVIQQVQNVVFQTEETNQH